MELSKDVLDLVRGAGLIGAPTTEAHDMWSWPLRPAIAMAKEIGARLMLVDVSTRSAWTTPYGSGGVGADRGRRTPMGPWRFRLPNSGCSVTTG